MASRNAGDGRYAIQAVCFAVRFHAGRRQPGHRPAQGSRLIPAPIPDYGAVAVPGVIPVPEGFTYYLRADLGWGFSTSRSYRENGALYALPFLATSPFGFGGAGFIGGGDAKGDGVFLGTVGYGAYFTPRLRGDLTVDFRSSADVKSQATYSYASDSGGTIVTVW